MLTHLNTVIDHGLNASTFTARVIASTGSAGDPSRPTHRPLPMTKAVRVSLRTLSRFVISSRAALAV